MIYFTIYAALLFLSANAMADGYTIDCAHVAESDVLKQAPHGARRVTGHILELKYEGGVKHFLDAPPYIDLGGLRWVYCGYDKENKVHLIEKVDQDYFTGIFVFEANGKILKAGKAVAFSPDKTRFLAIEQIEGKDGEDWTLYNFQGQKLWTGENSVPAKSQSNTSEGVYGELTNPSWNKEFNLIAEAVCSVSKSKSIVTLKHTEKEWNWLPKPEC